MKREIKNSTNDASCQEMRRKLSKVMEELAEYKCLMNPVLGRIFTKALGFDVECRIKIQLPDVESLKCMGWNQLISEYDDLKASLKELKRHWEFWQWELNERRGGDMHSFVTWAADILKEILDRRGWPDRIEITPAQTRKPFPISFSLHQADKWEWDPQYG